MDDPAKDSLVHQLASPSPASQSASQSAHAQSAHATKAVMEAKKRFNTAMEDDVSDLSLGIVFTKLQLAPYPNRLLICVVTLPCDGIIIGCGFYAFQLLDYKHNHPQLIENCAVLLIKIFNNILEHPHEEKYRQVFK